MHGQRGEENRKHLRQWYRSNFGGGGGGGGDSSNAAAESQASVGSSAGKPQ